MFERVSVCIAPLAAYVRAGATAFKSPEDAAAPVSWAVLPRMRRTVSSSRTCGLRRFVAGMLSGLVLVLNSSFAQVRITDEEKARFQDAPQRYPARSLNQVKSVASQPFWVDESSIVFSSRSFAGSDLSPVEVSKIIKVNADTGTVEELPFRGVLVCYSNGTILVSIPTDPTSESFNWRTDRLLRGPAAGALTQVEFSSGSQILTDGCAVVPRQQSSKELVNEFDFPHGGARFRVGPWPEYGFVTEQGGWTVSAPPRSSLQLAQLSYLPWMNAYFWPDSSNRRTSILVDAYASAMRQVTTPDLLWEWSQSSYFGSALPVMTKLGAIWPFLAKPDAWNRNGLYLVPDVGRGQGGLIRIDDGEVETRRLAVSPSGCRLFYRRASPSPQLRTRSTLIKELCEERK